MGAQIMETNNYSLFVISPFNRIIKRTQFLETAIFSYGFLNIFAIWVQRMPDGKLMILDGHHRFEVARRNRIPVKYLELTTEEIKLFKDLGPQALFEIMYAIEKAKTPWSLQDCLSSFIQLGRPDYARVQAFQRNTGIALSQCIAMLGGGSATAAKTVLNRFRKGAFKLNTDMTEANKVGEIVIACKKAIIPFSHNHTFVAALSKLSFVEKFNPTLMISKILSYPDMMKKQVSMADYIKMLEDIYNKSTRAESRLPLSFLAEEAARQRLMIPREVTKKAAPKKTQPTPPAAAARL